jgi:hypothetical protein
MKHCDVLGVSSDSGAIAYLKALGMDRMRISHGFPEDRDWRGIRLLVTGAALGASDDKGALEVAQDRGIPTVCIIDHWTHLAARFHSPSRGRTMTPDAVVVNDEVAKSRLRQEGISAENIHPLGNPVLERLGIGHLASRDHGESGKPQSLLFVSEEVPTPDDRLGIGDLGYDEYSVLQSILQTIPRSMKVEVRLHPADEQDKYCRFGSRLSLAARESVRSVVQRYDYIVGMDSMFLLELASLKSGIISYRPNALESLAVNHLNALVEVKSPAQLAQELQESTRTSLDFSSQFEGSSARIRKFLESKLS